MLKFQHMFLALSLVTTLSHAKVRNKVIYGEDNRLDLYQVADQKMLDLANSTAAMVPNDMLELAGGKLKAKNMTLADQRICADERFAKQTTVAVCSGSLVGPDLLMTAGHCIQTLADCQKHTWVFGYSQPDAEKTEFSFEKSQTYKCVEIVERDLNRFNNNDYALVRLDRQVRDVRPLEVRKSGKIEDSTAIVVMGHPTGLPLKVSNGAKVRQNGNNIFFSANLDTFGGNSGSAVFNEKTGVIEGILVRGEQDYEFDTNASCYRPKKCLDSECRGEDVTRVTNIRYFKEH